jgi:FkbM family methyltransferase
MRFRTLTGSLLRLLPNASDSLSGFWYYGLPDFEELAFTLHLLGSGDLFVDVGANQGGWSLVAAGRGARVFAFEPVPLTRERLNANIAENSNDIRGRIRVFPFGLSDEAGQVGFTADLDAGNHRVSEQSGARTDVIYVDLVRADNVLRGEDPVLLKIDVEGEELRVLKGAPEVLSKPSLLAVVMETFRPLNFASPSLIEAEAILREHDFAPMAYDPKGRELHPLIKPGEGMQNTIYVRSPDLVLSRIRRSSPLPAFGGSI